MAVWVLVLGLPIVAGGVGVGSAHGPSQGAMSERLAPLGGDMDGDFFPDAFDNCPAVPNTDQADNDEDGLGDACDDNDDFDAIPDVFDNCPFYSTSNQSDQDSDGVGDFCDNCPAIPNVDQADQDSDYVGDACDPCQGCYERDFDGDGRSDSQDNCVLIPNPSQSDTGGSSAWIPLLGDACGVPRIALVGTTLTDDGDDDGFADTLETVELRLMLRNVSGPPSTGVAFTGLTARLWTDDPDVCISQPVIQIATLGIQEEALTEESFVFHVGDVQRTDPGEDLSVTFQVFLSSDQFSYSAIRNGLALDLDLDALGGGDPATFYEGFEGGDLGAFQALNLDAGIPGNNSAEGLQNAEGFRCQTSDPDWVNSSSYGTNWPADNCFPGRTLEHADATFWQIDGSSIAGSPDGGRAYTGSHALYYGVFLTRPAGEFTTPTSVIEGAGTTQPIDLGLEQPRLSFKHQISLLDGRATTAPDRRSIDRAVVQAQVADATGQPASVWLNLEPYLNQYDSAPYDNYFNCMFDPVDDGSVEDDFYSPVDSSRRLGPSSTCEPQLAYSYVGDTVDPFQPENTGNAHEGPGLEGSLGVGTWLESAFDLGRFRGRRIRLRFLTSAFMTTGLTYEDQLALNPDSRDDGWWIDDVTVTGAVTSPVTIVADIKDNSGLPGAPGIDGDGDGFNDVCDNCPAVANLGQLDGDVDGAGNVCDPCPSIRGGADVDLDQVCDADDNCPSVANPTQQDIDADGFGFACDCADWDASSYPGAPEINDGQDNQCSGEPGHGLIDELLPDVRLSDDPFDGHVLSWTAQPGANRYRVVRGQTPDLSVGCTLFPQITQAFVVLPEQPSAGAIYHYLVRAAGPNPGTWGVDSSGTERVVQCDGATPRATPAGRQS